ncbi:MAG: MOSC domain-containing protein [Gemmatimonadetes bacterium]|nr:MOSC domain-containing protein [Gemmatimonadota bacterium]
MAAHIVSIHITPAAGAAIRSVAEARAVPGKGLEGDRYATGTGFYSGNPRGHDEITLIEVETIEALARDHAITIGPGDARRNLVTRGVALNHLVGREFRVGEVRLRGLRLCEPCGHLESLTQPGVKSALVHRGGLRAQLLTEGTIRAGDPVQET